MKTKRVTTILMMLAFMLASIGSQAQPGTIDTTFNPTDIGFGNGNGLGNFPRTTCIQSDGKILIGGGFYSYNGTAKYCIIRLNTNGSLDTSFNSLGLGASSDVTSIVIQSDGKIIIGGFFTDYNGTPINRIARLNADGSLDLTFNPGTGANNIVRNICIQSDGKIIVGGHFTAFNGITKNRIVRLNTNGSIDTTFNPAGAGANNLISSIALQSSGKIIIGGDFTSYNGVTKNHFARINTDGSVDGTFNSSNGTNDGILSMAMQSDDKIIVGGKFTGASFTSRSRIARINADGSLDVTFDPGAGANDDIQTVALQSDGKVIIGGYFTTYNGTTRNHLARLNTDGSLDGSFLPTTGAGMTIATGFYIVIYSTTIQSDGKIIVGGTFTSYNGTTANYLARINTDGSIDGTFNSGTGANSIIFTTSLQSDGKIIIGGQFTKYNGKLQNRIARLNSDGSLDSTFNTGIGTNAYVESSAIQNDGKILIGGNFDTYNGIGRNHLVRLNTDGSLDLTFNMGTGPNYYVSAITVQSDGKIIIGGGFGSYNGTPRGYIARLNMDGSLDLTFNSGVGANIDVSTIALQSDGKIIIGGLFTDYNAIARNHVARLNTDGSLDLTFNPGTGADVSTSSTVIQSDGKIILGGYFTSYNGTTRNYIARLNTDGSLDGTFNPGTGANDYVSTVALQSDGKIIIGGSFFIGIAKGYIARLNTDGSLDGTFIQGTGANERIESTAIQSDGKIIIAGYFTGYNGTGRNCIARINGDLCITAPTINCPPNQTANASANCTAIVNYTSTAIATGNPIPNISYVFTGATTGSGFGNGSGHIFGKGITTVTVKAANACGSATCSFYVIVSDSIVPGITCQGPVTVNANYAGCTYNGVLVAPTATDNCSAVTVIGPVPAGPYPAGTTVVTWTATDASGNAAICTQNITVNVLQAVNISGATTLCGGSSTLLDAGAGFTAYSWSTGETTQSISVNTAGTFTATVTNAIGCTASTSVTTTLNSLPPPAIIGTTTFCNGSLSLLDAGIGYTTYNWSTGATTQSISVNTAGIFAVTVSNVLGCTGSASVTATVNAVPNPSISGTTTFCSSSSTLLNAGVGFSSYYWSTGATTQSISVNSAGVFTATVTNVYGCTGSASATTIVNASPAPSISGTTTFCSGSSTLLDAGAGYSSYHWSTGATTQTLSISSAGTFAVTVTNPNGCSASATAAITVNANPNFVITGNNAFCAGNSTSLNAGAGYSSYNWSTGATTQSLSVNTAGLFAVTVSNVNGCTASASVTTIINALPTPSISGGSFCVGGGTILNENLFYNSYLWSTGATTKDIHVFTAGVFTVTVTNANGCTGSATVTTTIIALPTPSISGTTTICSGSSTLLDVGAGFLIYKWSTGATTQSISVNSAGIYRATVTNTYGCTASAAAAITVNTSPNPVISGSKVFCIGGSTTLNAGSGFISYLWSTGETTQTINVNTAGIFTATVTNAIGCSASATAAITVSPNPNPVITGSMAFCSGSSTLLNASSGFSSYSWSTGATTQTISVNTAGIFTVTVTNANGCSGSTVVTTTVNASPIPVIIGSTVFCIGGSTMLNAGLGFSSYLWSTGATTQSINVNTAATFTVTVTNASGCTASASITTSISAKPSPAITGNLTPCSGSSTILTTGSYIGYLWSTGETTQAITVAATANYKVTVSNATGCTGSTSVKVIKQNSPSVIVTPSASIICPPDISAVLVASGTASTFVWSPAIGLSQTAGASVTASPAATTTYTVTGTSLAGCTATLTTRVTLNPKPSILTTTNIMATGATANWDVVSCAVGYSLQYRVAGGVWIKLNINTNTTTKVIAGLTPSTNYQWRVRAKYPDGTYSSYSSIVSFATPALREGEQIKSAVCTIYPNPATDKLIVEFPFSSDEANIQVINALGQTVLKYNANNTDSTIELNIAHLPTGLYLIEVINGSNRFTSNFIKE